MRIGLDLDGTIIAYDAAFHRRAVALFGLPSDVPVKKTSVRDWLRSNEPGERAWIELQRLVYGPEIMEATLAPGLAGFLAGLRGSATQISIISHKSRFSAAEPPVDLHAAAYAWLERHGFFDRERFAVDRRRVFFEASRADKIRRVESERCVLFVDDLAEVFEDPAFPSGVERWLYEAGVAEHVRGGVRCFSDWTSVGRHLEELGRV
jgi:hypothetical protein